MAVKYEIDGNVFREIDEKWLVAHVKEYLIKARATQTDEAGNKIEVFRLNDGRCFSRLLPQHQEAAVRQPHTQPIIQQEPASG